LAVGKEARVDDGAEYVSRNQQELERLREMGARLTDADLDRVLPGSDWTVADALAHLAFYDRRVAILCDRFAREGVSASPFDAETINQALLPLTRRSPPREVVAEAIAAAEAADRAVAAIPDDRLAAIRERNEVKPERWVHRKSHLDDIEAAIA
jgi:hypothetical protein